MARVSAAINSDRVELAPEPVHQGAWVSDYDVDPFDVPDADKTGLLTELSERLMAADGVEHVETSCMAVKELKYYADTAGTRTTQQRVRINPDLTALTVDRATGAFESMRTLAPPAGRGWEYLTGTGWDWDAELAEIPELLREKTKAPSVEPGRYDLVDRPVQPVAHHPRVGRARHRARPCAGLRGRVRGHLVRDRRQARHAAVRVAGHERHRRPHRPSRPVQRRLGRRGRRRPAVGHREGRRAGRLPGRPEHGPAARPAAVQRVRVRRLVGARAAAAHGQRVAAAGSRRAVDRRDHRRGRARHLRRRRQELVDRHAALQLPVHRPALLPDRGRPARRAVARRRLPGDDDRLLGLDGRAWAARRPTCSAAPSTAARPSPARWRRSATAARRPCSRQVNVLNTVQEGGR